MNTAALNAKTVLLTGAAGDIGAAYTTAFAALGAHVIAADLPRFTDTGTRLAEQATSAGPGSAVFVPCDITSDDDLHAAVELGTERFGGVDVLVNNAAIYQGLGAKRGLSELTNDDWDTVLRVNVRGSWQAIRAVVPVMRERGGGRIVNIASVVSRTGAAGFAHYVASKAAVEGLTRAAARELGQVGITVNAVSPGLVDDAATRAINDETYVAQMARTRSLPRSMCPEDLVGAVLWLSGPESAFITGQTLVVDGGGVFV
ncbi:SDR family NAD(P)-dependent oxidoreductase [Saccharopolyspora phatthalungensis]|uniref:NAD(P)-dependent dehydrogenase (Short-subunit alcohol dehydrogenase family) n=1 Tax=Saccharopolyspora phatthalungensis TaxID=664693 RepID=A0A840Q8K7_9PSEU|nr:SDR family oxidoreductase [Saccharopolyspora phatthalungensis]MBB5158862.1 NAD(P)-dependent dehydrogenase (short-subunit alcohol dehydrogenase family) [Saccharopolyspora phatthalungensis]